ncbi:MAG: tyrosine-type recombinase/integrase [Eubacteriales bacterium]|nr:tyrosine-type recombinase/integrase [Eubacteriales bacterium]
MMPSISKRGSTYRVFVSLGSNGAGKPIRKSTTFKPPVDISEKKRRALALSFAYEYEAELRFNNSMDSSKTFSEFADWYYRVVAPLTLKEHTIINNSNLIKNYVLQHIGGIRLRNLSPIDIDNMTSYLIKEGAKCKKGGLKISTVKQIRMAVSAILSTAVRKGIINLNPVFAATPIKKQRDLTRYEGCPEYYLDESACKKVLGLCDGLKNQQIARAIKLLLFTGLRRGELMGLHWEDVDFERGELNIRYTKYRINGKVMVTTPKTTSSVRRVPIGQTEVEILKEQLKYVNKTRRNHKCGKKWEKTGAVFINRNGGYMNGEFLNNSFRTKIRNAGMPGLHLHDLRHANASILINNGVPMKVVADHLGHSSIRTTEAYYIHLFENSRRVTADVIASVLV